MKNFEQPPQTNEEEKMGREKFQELTSKPEGLEILDQKFPITDEKNLEDTIYTAAKDALANNAIRQVILELEPGAYEKEDGNVENYYVTPEYAKKILSEKDVKRIEGNIANREK